MFHRMFHNAAFLAVMYVGACLNVPDPKISINTSASEAPGTVSDVSAKAFTTPTAKVELSWKLAGKKPDSFSIYRGDESKTIDPPTGDPLLVSKEYASADTSVTIGKKYFYRVAAKVGSTQGAYSSIVSINVIEGATSGVTDGTQTGDPNPPTICSGPTADCTGKCPPNSASCVCRIGPPSVYICVETCTETADCEPEETCMLAQPGSGGVAGEKLCRPPMQ